MNNDITRELAQMCVDYSYSSLPEDVVTIAKMSLMDNLGCAIRGVKEDIVEIIASELFQQTVSAEHLLPLSHMANTKPNDRAMLHGIAAHAIDFDDTFIPALAAHAGNSVIGAVMALLPEVEATGEQVIEAIVAGYEISGRVGQLLNPNHYLNGFHPTCTVGVFASAATASKLMGFNVEQTQSCIGLAATQASGLKCTFGTMAKPFNAGNAAASGVLSARLIARGFTAPDNSIEEPKGYLDMFMGLPPEERAVAPATSFCIKENLFKAHAACHATHPLIEGIKRLQEEHPFAAEELESMDVTVPDLSLKTASIVTPTSGLECKFSFNQMAACALAGLDTAADSTFTDEVAQDPAIAEIRNKVTVTSSAEMGQSQIIIKVTLKSGENLSLTIDFTELMQELTSQLPSLKDKFLANASSSLSDEQASKLLDAILQLETANNGATHLSLNK